MKVAIDAGALSKGHKVRGVGKYTKNLISALEELSKTIKDFSLEPLEFDLADNDKLAQFDILHYPYFDLFFTTLPRKKITKTIVTVHDVIPLLYPKHYPPGIRGKIKFEIQKNSLKAVNAVITDTQTSKKDIVRFLDYPSAKIFPIHLAPANDIRRTQKNKSEKILKKYKLPKEFVLYIGDVNYNKNIAELVKACVKIKAPLVIIGKQAKDFETQQYKAQLSGGIKDRLRYLLGKNHPELAHYDELKTLFENHKKFVFRLGYVEDEDFNTILGNASVYCQPSLYEGFGLPVLEAMQAGVPVVASQTQALVEIAEGAAYFVEDKTSVGFSKALAEVINDKKLSSQLVKAGYKKVHQYSWAKTALETYEIYKKVYKGI